MTEIGVVNLYSYTLGREKNQGNSVTYCGMYIAAKMFYLRRNVTFS